MGQKNLKNWGENGTYFPLNANVELRFLVKNRARAFNIYHHLKNNPALSIFWRIYERISIIVIIFQYWCLSLIPSIPFNFHLQILYQVQLLNQPSN